MVFPHEKRTSDEICSAVMNGCHKILLQGPSGCGKTHTINLTAKLLEKEKKALVLRFEGDPFLSTEALYPIKSGLTKWSYYDMRYIPQNIMEGSKSVPKLGGALSAALSIIFTSINHKKSVRSKLFSDEGHDLACKLESLAKRSSLIIICDDLQYWDDKSLQWLYLLMKNSTEHFPFMEQVIILCTLTTTFTKVPRERIDIIEKLSLHSISFSPMTYNDFSTSIIQLGYCGNLKDEDCRVLFNLVDGHLQMLLTLIDEINQNGVDNLLLNQTSRSLFQTMLKNRLQMYGVDSKKIRTSLQYASILGLTFSRYELLHILSMEADEFERVIDQSIEINLLNKAKHTNSHLRFVHEIVREAFHSNIENDKNQYYSRIEQCLARIAPEKYMRRASYLLKANQISKASEIFVLELLRQLRAGGSAEKTDLDTFFELTSSDCIHLQTYMKQMQTAYQYYCNNQYEDAYIELEAMGDIWPSSLCAEKYLLSSLCLSKRIDPASRQQAIKRVMSFTTVGKCGDEIDVFERVLMRLLVLNVHYGQLEQAKHYESELVNSLKARITIDSDAKKRFEILNRISSALYNSEIACKKIKSSVTYFGPSEKNNYLWEDLGQYFMALVNYSGVLCTCGKFHESNKVCNDALELLNENPSYPFPRSQILLNNYFLSGYLSGNLRISDALKGFQCIVDNIGVSAERLFYVSNLSVLQALNNQVELAKSTLELEANLQNTNKDAEKIYKYRVLLNCASYTYLLGDCSGAINLIEKIPKEIELHADGALLYRRVSKLKAVMEQEILCTSSQKWENILFSIDNRYQKNSWDYYGKGFAFSALSNWDL